MSLKPVNEKIEGQTAKTYFLSSGLSMRVLATIWHLSDADADGSLTRIEFYYASVLVDACLKGHPIPRQLPQDLVSQVKRAVSAPFFSQTSTGSAPNAFSFSNQPLPGVQGDQAVRSRANEYVIYFNSLKSSDNIISGATARNIFAKSGISFTVLANIWEVADADGDGCLTVDEFGVAMARLDSYLAPGFFNPLQQVVVQPKGESDQTIERINSAFSRPDLTELPSHLQRGIRLSTLVTRRLDKMLRLTGSDLMAKNNVLGALKVSEKNIREKIAETESEVSRIEKILDQTLANMEEKHKRLKRTGQLVAPHSSVFRQHSSAIDFLSDACLISIDDNVSHSTSIAHRSSAQIGPTQPPPKALSYKHQLQSFTPSATWDLDERSSVKDSSGSKLADTASAFFSQNPSLTLNADNKNPSPSYSHHSSSPFDTGEVLKPQYSNHNELPVESILSLMPQTDDTLQKSNSEAQKVALPCHKQVDKLEKRSSIRKKSKGFLKKIFDTKPNKTNSEKIRQVPTTRPTFVNGQPKAPKVSDSALKNTNVSSKATSIKWDKEKTTSNHVAVKSTVSDIYGPCTDNMMRGSPSPLLYDVTESAVASTVDSHSFIEDSVEELEPPLEVIAVKDFSSQKSSFAFKVGDRFIVTFQNKKFMYAELGALGDWFPANFVEESALSTAECPFLSCYEDCGFRYALYDNVAEESNDVPFDEGDVLFESRVNGEWIEGYGNGITGIYPTEFTDVMPSLHLQGVHTVVKACSSTNDYELSLKAGDKVGLLHTNASGWSVGVKGNSEDVGFFPTYSIGL